MKRPMRPLALGVVCVIPAVINVVFYPNNEIQPTVAVVIAIFPLVSVDCALVKFLVGRKLDLFPKTVLPEVNILNAWA